MRVIRCLIAAALITSVAAYAQLSQGPEFSSATAVRTAEIIGVRDQIKQFSEASKNSADGLRILSLRQEISEKVLAASLQTDATLAQIDNEIAQANELRGYLADKRDHAVNRANLLGIIAGGALGASSAALQLPKGESKPSSVVGIAGGAASLGLGLSGIRAQRGGTRVFDFNSNMLAKLFDRPMLPDSDYAPMIWNFLNDVAPTDPDRISRKERLIRTWVKVKRMDGPSTAAGQQKIVRITSQPSEGVRLTIDDLEDRAAMLDDLRAKLSFLKRDLAAVVLTLPQR